MRLTNNQMALLAILFMIVSLVGNSIVYQRASMAITGKATTGQLSICLNHPPVLDIGCSNSVVVGSAYSCNVDVTDPNSAVQSLTFSDNATLFDIGATDGVISFTPTNSQNGSYSITILVEDNSSCSNSIDSDVFNLTVIKYYCGDGSCNGEETCSTCQRDCGKCGAAPAAAGGGGGGGGGSGESSKGCHANLCNVDSKTLRTKQKEIVWICFGFVGYELKITNVDENSITMFVDETKDTISVNLGEKKALDMNKDGLLDMSIELIRIREKDVWIFFEPIVEGEVICKKTKKDALVVEPSIMRVSIKLWDVVEKTVSVSNVGSEALDVNVELRGLENILSLKEESFSLEAFQKRIINAVLDASGEGIKPGVYNGKVVFSAEDVRKEITLIVEVETKKVIFDVKTNIPSEYKSVNKGKDISANIDLYNLEGVQEASIRMAYQIRDSEGNIIVNEEEIITAGDDISFTKEMDLPDDVIEGKYVFVVMAKYSDSVGTASDVFEVKVRELFAPVDYSIILAMIIVILIIMGVIFGILVHHQRKIKQLPRKINKRMVNVKARKMHHNYVKRKRMEEKIDKQKEGLKKKLKALEEGYRSGYISKEVYEKSKGDVEKYLGKK